MNEPTTNVELLEENERLRLRLDEAEAIVEAIRSGVVDAVVVHASPSESIYTLEGADRPYRLLVEAMHQGVALLNRDGVLLYCNPGLVRLFSTTLEMLIGHQINSLVATADLELWTDLFRNLEGGLASTNEIRMHRPDGTSFPASLALTVLPMRKFCLAITDLSQQKLYEQLLTSKVALRESEIRYRRLFETAKDGVLILDSKSGRITDVNPFMSELLGYTHEHFLGKEPWEIGLFSDKSANEAAVRELKEHGYIRYEHLPLETNRGLRVEVEVVANAYQEDEHRVIQCNIRDITDRSRLEKQLKDQADALADLDRRKDEFLAMLSHELRNPLAPISNATQILSLQKNEGKLQQKARAIIERQVKQLTRLVDDLLEVSRITTGKIHLQKERLSLVAIAERAIEVTAPLMTQHLHEFHRVPSPEPLWLYADAARLEQVVVNLLNNAVKYTPNGGRISLSIQRDADVAVLRVQDTGVGIAPDVLPLVFDLFTQAERSLDRSQGGLGIGLSLVKRLVEMHGGRVDASSTLGRGSEFVVRLPLAVTPLLPLSPTDIDVEEPPGPSLRVLVVDDNVDAAETLGLLLESLGHDVRLAFDGLTALTSAVEFQPDVVLLDLGLPGLNGFDVAKELRRNFDLSHVVLVAMTGYGQETDRLRSHEAGFDHHLVKPTVFEKLEQILATVIATVK